MSERLRYWRQLFMALIGEISSPLSETVMGGVAAFVFLWYATHDYSLTMNMKTIFAFLFVPSFLMLMHGMSRLSPHHRGRRLRAE